MYSTGNLDLLKTNPIALFCSVKCPGELITKTYDLCLKWRKEGQPVISGFHSPMEQECLRILLKGRQPIIVSPARGIWRRIPQEIKPSLDPGRLLIATKFPDSVRRITAETSQARNRFIGELTSRIFVSYAEPGGKLEALCKVWIQQCKPVCTFDGNYNKNLITLGAAVL